MTPDGQCICVLPNYLVGAKSDASLGKMPLVLNGIFSGLASLFAPILSGSITEFVEHDLTQYYNLSITP